MSKQIHYLSGRKLEVKGGMLDFLTKPDKASAIEKTLETIREITPKGYLTSNWRDICGAGGHTAIIYLNKKVVNSEIVKGYENRLKEFEFPYWTIIGLKDGQLYFCIIHEPCSPNWNHEATLEMAVPLAEINVPVISDASGIDRIDETVYNLLYNQAIGLDKANFPDYGEKPTKGQLAELINMGMPCYFRYGWKYRGAVRRKISKEYALQILPNYDYGKGFYYLDYAKEMGMPTLTFNELSELDME